MIRAIYTIAEHFGNNRQLLQTMEECAELAKECSKTIRQGKATEGLTEEIGDVCLMIVQIMHLHRISDNDVLNIMKKKIDRTMRLIETENKENESE